MYFFGNMKGKRRTWKSFRKMPERNPAIKNMTGKKQTGKIELPVHCEKKKYLLK